MNAMGLYWPGNSVLHRLPAGWKLLAMLALMVALVVLHRPWELGAAAVAVVVGYVIARIPAVVVWRQLRPLRWMLAVIAALQVIFAGWQTALMVCGGLILAIAIAALVTLTTKVSSILDVCQRVLRPLRRVGLDPDRVGLVLAMTIRCIPLLTQIVDEVSQARKARGLGFSLVALMVPVIVRALRSADAMGEALIARGMDD